MDELTSAHTKPAMGARSNSVTSISIVPPMNRNSPAIKFFIYHSFYVYSM